MSTFKTFGIILIVAGAIALGYQTISYNKQHELFRVGDASATVTTTETKQIPMWVGFALVGVGLLVGIHRKACPEEVPELALCRQKKHAIRL